MSDELATRVIANFFVEISRNTHACALRKIPGGPLDMRMLAFSVAPKMVRHLHRTSIQQASIGHEGERQISFSCKAAFARRHAGVVEDVSGMISVESLGKIITLSFEGKVSVPHLRESDIITFCDTVTRECWRLTNRSEGQPVEPASSYIGGGRGTSSVGGRPAGARLFG